MLRQAWTYFQHIVDKANTSSGMSALQKFDEHLEQTKLKAEAHQTVVALQSERLESIQRELRQAAQTHEEAASECDAALKQFQKMLLPLRDAINRSLDAPRDAQLVRKTFGLAEGLGASEFNLVWDRVSQARVTALLAKTKAEEAEKGAQTEKTAAEDEHRALLDKIQRMETMRESLAKEIA